MKTMIARFEKLTLIKKIIIVYAAAVILPVFILVTYLSKTEYERLYSQAVNSKQLALEQITQNTRTSMISAEDLSLSLAYRSPISSLVSRNNLNKFPVWTKRSSEESMEAVKYTLKCQNLGIEEISVYSNKSELFDNEVFFDESLLYGFDFFNNFKFQQKDSDFYFLDENTTETYYNKKGISTHEKEILLLVRNIRNEEEGIYSGLLLFEINPAKFLSSSSGAEYGDYTIYFPNIKTFWGEELSEDIITAIQTSSGKNKVNYSQVASGYLYANIKDYNVFIVDKNAIDNNNYIILVLGIFAAFIFLIIVQALGLRYLIKYILKKVNKNINEMDKIVANGFKGEIYVEEDDEFRYITRRYNVLVHKIRTLISDIIKKERDSKEAQIKALQYQMNPHFIYNTLSIFASNAEESRNYQLSEAISYFGHLLRYNIKNTGMFATVREELDNAYSLIRVYSIRCREKLEIKMDVPEELYDIRIVKYLLQPILENAILHGGRAERKQMTIKLCARCCEGLLIIEIEDNGTGIEEEHLIKIRKNIVEGKELENTSGNSSFIGLRNIYKRLQLIYGEESDLWIDSEYGCGTRIGIKIPVSSKSERDENENFDINCR